MVGGCRCAWVQVCVGVGVRKGVDVGVVMRSAVVMVMELKQG
jgi:hypothetical protein